jgi:general secretion pathway protein D
MDQSAIQQTDIVKLKYGVAEDVVSMLEKLKKSEAKASGAEAEVLLVADPRTNSVLVNGDELERSRLRTLIRHLDTPLKQSGNVRVMYLEYADAKDVAEVLSKVMKNMEQMESGEGKNRNALSSNKGASIEQVLVEAIIVEMAVGDGQDLGLQWLFAEDDGFYGSNITGADARAREIAGAILPPNDDDDDVSEDFDLGNLAAALAGTPGLSLGWGTLDDDFNMTVILSALKEQTNSNILSTPSLLTLDNQEAFITVGQEVPFVTGSFTNTGSSNGATNPFQTIERESVGITLKVTPHINEGDAVVLDIEQEVSSLSPASVLTSDVVTNERRIQTKVLAKDGRVIVLGGLIKDDISETEQKVPFLGDIPYFGRLFRNDSVTVTKTNLMIFIRTTIIRDDEDLAGATAEKYGYIRDKQQASRDRGLRFLDDQNLPLLPEWEEQIQQLPEAAPETSAVQDEAAAP